MQKVREEGTVWKRTSIKVYFDHQDMDYYFRWMLSRQVYGGATTGECFYAASRIEDGNPESWQIAWRELAERIEARAAESLAKGHTVSAREAYLRATTYYRAPVIMMSPRHPDFMSLIRKFQACFRQAAALFNPPVEPVQVPFEGKALSAYFLKPDASDKKRKTLIMIGGGETFAEDLFFYIGPAGIKRGYNVLLVDLPGQGALPADGLFFRTDPQVPVRAVVDYLLARPDVDENKLAIYGISGGGNFVPHAVTVEKRIKALVANPPYYDVIRTSEATQQMRAGGLDAIAVCFWEQFLWRGTGQCDLKVIDQERARKERAQNNFDPREITCPTLSLAAAGELPEWLDQAHKYYERVPDPVKALHILTAEDGAEGHCHMDNLSLMSQIVFDWLDEVFQG